MGFLIMFSGIIGFGIGIVLGLCIGFYFFIYSDPQNEAFGDPVVRPISELDTTTLQDLAPEIPLWVKNPDYDRADWLNKFVLNVWPYLDKAVCAAIRRAAEPIVADYVGHGHRPIEAITFKTLSLGTLPPVIQGVKVYETNEKELVIEPAIKWAGNQNIVVAVKISSLLIQIQLVDLQVFAAPRVTLKPLVPTFPCFANIVVSLMEKPHVDFGMKVLGGDVMSIPGLYRLAQDIIRKEVAKLYLWPRTLEIPILDSSFGAMKKPVGVLHVKVVRATKLMKMDILGLSDPYVKLKLSGEMLPSKKTTIKKKTLNPEWNETFKLVVKDPQAQSLQINVYDWDKVPFYLHGHLRFLGLCVRVGLTKMTEMPLGRDVAHDLLSDTFVPKVSACEQMGLHAKPGSAEMTEIPLRRNVIPVLVEDNDPRLVLRVVC